MALFALAPPLVWLLVILASVAAFAALGLGLFWVYIWVRYVPKVARMFQQPPMFRPLVSDPDPGGEDVRFRTTDGLELAGTYYRAETPSRIGVVVFCHEFLGDRHSAYAYVGKLRARGFDLFVFDFRNHGDSQAEPGLVQLQWLSDRELNDLRAALAYVRSRPDADAAGVGLFGVSRGGSTALYVTAEDPGVWAVATDGAYPTRSTMLSYVHKWAIILVKPWSIAIMPRFVYRWVAWSARVYTERRLNRVFPRLESMIGKIPPRPWLAIHGANDSYIGPEIARELIGLAGPGAPVDVWFVPKAKHNRCREVAPEAYHERLASFFLSHAPRRPLEACGSNGSTAVRDATPIGDGNGQAIPPTLPAEPGRILAATDPH
jgi:pimeloyl-ACP methyl ester carboxylesterase